MERSRVPFSVTLKKENPMSEFDRPIAATHTTEHANSEANVRGSERIASLVGGGALLANGIRQGGLCGWLQVAAGVALAIRGTTGRSALKQATEASPWEQDLAREYGWRNAEAIQRSVTIARPRSEVFACVHDTSKLAQILDCVERIEPVGDGTEYRWTMRAPMGRSVDWTVRLEQATPNEKLLWISETGCPFEHRFTLSFADAPYGRGTEVHAVLACAPPAGRIGYAAASMISPYTGRVLNQQLRRIKQYLETGEVASSRMSPLHGQEAGGKPVPGSAEAQAGFGGAA
jgi:uncharacterized membrane protein